MDKLSLLLQVERPPRGARIFYITAGVRNAAC